MSFLWRSCATCLPSAAQRDGRLLLAIDREAAADLLPWAGAWLAEPFSLCFAQRGDISAVLASHSMMCAQWTPLMGKMALSTSPTISIESLQLDTIHADASPIVRLANSTLYDAYRAGASDIHLETTGGRIARQVPS